LDGGADKRHNILQFKATVEQKRIEKLQARRAKEERRKSGMEQGERDKDLDRAACLCDSGEDSGEDQQVTSDSDEGHCTAKGAPRTNSFFLRNSIQVHVHWQISAREDEPNDVRSHARERPPKNEDATTSERQ